MLRGVILIAGLLLFLVNGGHSYAVSPNNDDCKIDVVSTCTTPGCKSAGDKLISAMNQTVDPCDDFYQYACGGWIAQNPKPLSEPFWYAFQALRKQISSEITVILKEENQPNDPLPVRQARDYYAACMDTKKRNERGLEPLLKFYESHGGWPMAGMTATKSWQKLMAETIRLYSNSVLLKIVNDADKKNATRNRIHIDQTSFILSRSALVDLNKEKKQIEAYKKFIREAAKEIRNANTKQSFNAPNDLQIDIDVADMIDFESKLAHITTSDEDLRNNTGIYNPMSLIDLQTLTDNVKPGVINWKEILNDIYFSGVGIRIEDSETVIVDEIDYIKKLVALLSETKPVTIDNYVHWRIIYQLASSINQRMKDLILDFNRVISGTKEHPRLDEICTNEAITHFGYAISYRFVESKFDKTYLPKVKIMIENTKKTFITLFEKADWMDEPTRKFAIHKVNNMNENVGYPNWLMNVTELEYYYSGLSISREDYFASHQRVSALANVRNFKELKKNEHDLTIWPQFPIKVNAYYDPRRNSITITAAALDYPLFKPDRLGALNYGAIGFLIGHEIAHGFDDYGRHFDSFGNSLKWWSDTILAAFKCRSQCFVDQYGSYNISDGTKLNAKTNLGENMADNSGIRAAFLAYKKYAKKDDDVVKLPDLEYLTSEKLFFLSFANVFCGSATTEFLKNLIATGVHSPSHLRVFGTLSNNIDFLKAFQCSAGSRMNRENKCNLI